MRRVATLVSASLLIAGAALLLVGGKPAFDARAPFAGTDAVNAVLGDASFVAAFGRTPTAADGDDLRIRTHLAYVERLLRARDVRHLSPELRSARARQLDRLHAYRLAGVFPRNTVADFRTPVFVDPEGRICAVGYLFEQDRGRAAAEHVNAQFRTASVFDITNPVLADWLASSGLTLEEAAMIQPAYGPSFQINWSFDTAAATACGTNENRSPVVSSPLPTLTATTLERAPLLTCNDSRDDALSASGFSASYEATRSLTFGIADPTWGIAQGFVTINALRSTSGPTELRLLASYNGGAFGPVGTIALGTTPTSMTFFTASISSTVQYRIEARGGDPSGLLHLDRVFIQGQHFTPVELTAFTGAADGDAAALAWETASETNNAGFEVEHHAPGASDFAVVGFVEGHGTTTEPQRYAFRAEALAPGTHAFRLRQVDFDGQSERSDAVEVEITTPAAFALSAAQPNPFAGGTAFTLAVARTQRVSLAVYDALGRHVAHLYDGVLDAGAARPFALDGRGLAAGLLVVRAVGEHFAASRVVTLVR